MSHFVIAARAVVGASLVGGFAWLGQVPATADANMDALAGMLSKGYDRTNCKPFPPAGYELAVLQCGQNSDPNGPGAAMYSLWTDTGALDRAFLGGTVNGVGFTLYHCFGNAPAPDTWSRSNAPNTTVGKIACGMRTDRSQLVWSNYSNRMLGSFTSTSSVDSLYQWWTTRGNS